MDIQISTKFEREAEDLTMSKSSLEVKLIGEDKAGLSCSTVSCSAYTACAAVRQLYREGLKWGAGTLCREGERKS